MVYKVDVAGYEIGDFESYGCGFVLELIALETDEYFETTAVVVA